LDSFSTGTFSVLGTGGDVRISFERNGAGNIVALILHDRRGEQRGAKLGLNQLLGPSGMNTLQQYKSEWPTVTLVQNFGANLPEPTLTVDQAQELLPILSSASERDSTGTVVPNTVNVQQALAEAAPVLSNDQLMILSAMLQEAEAKATISQLSPAH
jgi:hypothetical protein